MWYVKITFISLKQCLLVGISWLNFEHYSLIATPAIGYKIYQEYCITWQFPSISDLTSFPIKRKASKLENVIDNDRVLHWLPKILDCWISNQLISDIKFRTKVEKISYSKWESKISINFGCFKFRTTRPCPLSKTCKIFGN